MKKLDLYLIKKFLGPFLVVFFIVVFALSLQFIWQYINELAGKGLSLGVIFEFWGWASCTLLPNEIPLATLLASIMTLGGLGERNELLAMKAAGISLMRIMMPIMILSILITVGAFFTADRLVPYAFNKVYTLKQDITRTRDQIKIPTGIFYDGIDGYILRVADRNEETEMMYDLIIYDHTANAGNTSMTVADSGRIEITPDKENLIFNLYHGCSYTETNTMNFRDTTLELSRLRFDEQQLIIQLDNYRFQRSEKDNFGDELKSLGLKRLQNDRDSINRELDATVHKQVPRFASTMGMNYLYQIDTLLGKNKVFNGDFNLDSSLTTLTPLLRKQVLRSAAGKAEVGEEQIKNFERETSYNVGMIRRIDVESIIKFTLALSCLIFFFIGAPLGAIIRKGGFGTPVIISIFLYLIYYIIDMIGRNLAAKSGKLTPWEGALISTAILLPIAILLTRKSTQDSSLFNLDTYKAFFQRIGKWIAKRWHRFVNLFRKGGGKIRIVYMGTPEFAVAPLDKLIQGGYEVVGVVTAVDKPSGRGLTMNESAVKKYAVAHGIPVLQPEKLKDPVFLEQLAALKANLFVVVAFRMLPKEVWQMPKLGTFNLHASLLPQYRGAAPINWAIIRGEKFTGVTTFLLDEQIDTGKILFQESCPIEPYENAGDLHDKLMAMGADLVFKTVDAIENHRTKPYEQTSGLHKTLYPAPKLTRDNCHLDWSRSARAAHLLIRGLSPYPAAWTTLVKEDGTVLNVKIYESYVVPCEDDDPRPVGAITTDHKTWLEVRCGKNALRILNLQLAGKKRMDIGAFLLGFREPESYRFE
ncbi:MAG: methionyl-tRNA formyltransferase [Bacteroidales bacterium]|nr:methionyl-tRNA formyltransferase [Bacteroidales bacterium]